MRPKVAAGIGVGLALVIGGLSIAKWREARAPRDATESTIAVRITQRDAMGLPTKKSVIREPSRVRALVEALGVDRHPMGTCPADYAEAPIGIVLSGADVYSRRNVYVFGVAADGGTGTVFGPAGEVLSPVKVVSGDASVVTVTSAGCRVGPPSDVDAMKREIEGAKPMAE